MTPEQIGLVRDSWSAVERIGVPAAALFYARLFELDPSLRALFKGDLGIQGKRLLAMIKAAVDGLDRVDQLLPVVHALGQRHGGYGVRDAHYATVGTALLWTLDRGLGSAFNVDVRDAWTAVYGTLAAAMQHGARSDRAAPALAAA
ncbi:MAG: globin family protein [Caldimonas sp.]